VLPTYGKGWNERLMWDGQPEKALLPEREQTWKDLWQWHRVVREVGRSAGYLQRITKVAKGVV
jgi:hypothetical protein